MSPRISTRLLATQSDQRLLELVGRGYERAFEAIVHRYRKPLLDYCRRLGFSEARAEDVVQQALLKAWVALRGGTKVRELRPWLYRIVHNTAVNVIRSSPEARGWAADGESLASAAAEPELERRLAARDALTDIAALPPLQREAILMSAVDGRSHEEVASALGVSHGAVRGLLYRARTTLRGAAAALTPPPLLAWIAGGARVAPSAARLAEFSAAGGREAGGALLKGAAMCVTAALAAGAVLGPLQRHGAPARSGAALPHAHVAAGVGGSHSGAQAGTVAAAPGGSVVAGSHPVRLAVGAAPVGGGSLPAPALHGGSSPAAGHGPGAGSPVQTPVAPSVGAPVGGSGPTAGHAAENGAPAGGDGPHPSETPAGGAGGPKEGGESQSGGSEREAEEAREKAEREAELAREKAETEAEEAREREEEKTDGAPSGKDH